MLDINNIICKNLFQAIAFLIVVGTSLIFSLDAMALEAKTGEELFLQHCSGCHVNGGNIIRRGKTLKLEALKRRDLDDPDAIAKVALEGIGIMDGYKDVLKDGEEKEIAKWVWTQVQNAWIQG